MSSGTSQVMVVGEAVSLVVLRTSLVNKEACVVFSDTPVGQKPIFLRRLSTGSVFPNGREVKYCGHNVNGPTPDNLLKGHWYQERTTPDS